MTTKRLNCIDVICDGAWKLGTLSYLVPADLEVQIGDAVSMPLGKRSAYGLVVGSGNPTKATREISGVFGRRSGPAEIRLAGELAALNLCDFLTVARRLAPVAKRGNPARDAGAVDLVPGLGFVDLGRKASISQLKRRIEAVAPGVDLVRLAALEAEELSRRGQVLVLCPSKAMVGAVVEQFLSGAARLDQVPRGDEPSSWAGLVSGSLQIGVGTRAAALWGAADLAGIVVVDEDHPGHREVSQPYTHARDVAAARARAASVDLVLLSTNPSPGALGGGIKVVAVGAARHWPVTSVVARDPRRRWQLEMPREVAVLLADVKAAGGSAVVVSGSTRSTRRCSDCKHLYSCPDCSSGSCAHTSSQCPDCGSFETIVLGWDKAKTTRSVGNVAKVVDAHELRRVKGADCVVLYDIDPWLGRPELVPERGAANLILEAGRVAAGGRLIVVSTEPGAAVLTDLAKGDLLSVAKRAWESAKEAGLPPFGRQVSLVVSGSSPRTATWPGRVLGPRRLSDEEWEVMVLCSDSELVELEPIVKRLRRRTKVRVSVS